MWKFLKALDAWLFSPPYPFESVLNITDILLQASDPVYARCRAQTYPLPEPGSTQPVQEDSANQPTP